MGLSDASTTGLPVALAALREAVDLLQAESPDDLDDAGVLEVLRELEVQRRRMPAVDHRLITELECRSTAARYLTRGTAGLLVELWHVDVAEARARVRAASVLGPRTPLSGDAAFSALARPVADGDTPDPRSPDQRHHDALAALCRNALASGSLPANHGLSATMVLTLGLAELEAAAGVATTAIGGVVPIRDALALASDAHSVLCLFDTDGQPLHLGRGARLASPAQRLALYARDRGCTRPGCDIPAQWTQVHHLTEYSTVG